MLYVQIYLWKSMLEITQINSQTTNFLLLLFLLFGLMRIQPKVSGMLGKGIMTKLLRPL